MKKLIVIIFPFIASAQIDDTSYRIFDSIEYYFIEFLNDYRKIEYPKMILLIKGSEISNAALHHTKYLVNMESADGLKRLISHEETSAALGLQYRGNDTLLYLFSDRRLYYDPYGIFSIYGEVVQMHGAYERTVTVVGQKEIARQILQSFLNSKSHKEILDIWEYTHIGISIIQSKKSNAFYICVLPGVLNTSKYLHANTFFPYYYGNKLEDIQ
jgi:hypothetical protein